MGQVKKIGSSITRGNSKSYPLSLPASVYSTGASLFFAMKAAVDDDPLDTEAVVRKTLTDADIAVQNDKVVTWMFALVPADTDEVDPGDYLAEFKFVSADKATRLTFPDPDQAVWIFTVKAGVNRRTV